MLARECQHRVESILTVNPVWKIQGKKTNQLPGLHSLQSADCVGCSSLRLVSAARRTRLLMLTVSPMGFQPVAVGTIVVEVDDVVDVIVEVSFNNVMIVLVQVA